MKKAASSLILLLNVLVLPTRASAQKLAELKSRYPGQDAIMLNSSTQYKVSIRDNEPYVESRETEQMMYLSTTAATYMSRYGFTQSGFHTVTEYDAYTQTADNKKIKVTNFKTGDLRSRSVFYDDVKETVFNFPAIGEGAIGVLNQKILHKNPYLLPPHYIGRGIPVVNNELIISFPKTVSVKYFLKGLNTDKILFTESKRGNEITYKFQVKELDPLQNYSDAPSSSYYAPHVLFYIEKYTNSQGKEIPYLADSNALYKLNYSFVKDINREIGPDLKRIVDSLTNGVVSLEDKARRIYQWVQEQIKYIAFEAGMEGFIPRDANLVCTRRFGDCKDMSSILTVMLNAAGVPAYYTWIGTRSLPYSYRETPLPMVSNHMICAIQLKKDEFIFLDGTDATCFFGIPSSHIQGKEAMIGLGPDDYKIVTVPSPPKSVSVLTDSCFLQFTEKGITGSILQDLSGYFSMNTRDILNYYSEKDKEEYMKNRFKRGSNKFHLSNYDIAGKEGKEQVTLKAKFELQNYARKLADEWYINLNLLKLYEHEEIDYPKRTIPMEFNFRFIKRYITVLTIPNGYKVTYLPKSKSFSNTIWGFDIKYEQIDNKLILTQEFYNEHLLLQPGQFKEWNEVLENLYPLYKESISISKIL
jgi:hypothetical protein